MSWWTKHRKKVLPAAGLLALQFIPGVGQAITAGLGSLTGGLLGGAGAAGAAGAAEAGALATGATAAAVPGLSATGAGSQAAMLAAQNAGFGLQGLGLTADAASTAQGLSAGQQALGQGVGLLGKMPTALKAAPQIAQGVSMMSPQQQPMPMPPPPPPAPPQQQGPSPGGYGKGMDIQKMLADPNLPPEIRQKLMMMIGGVR